MDVRLQRCTEHLLLKEHQAGMICLQAGTAATDSRKSGAVAMCIQMARARLFQYCPDRFHAILKT